MQKLLNDICAAQHQSQDKTILMHPAMLDANYFSYIKLGIQETGKR